MSSAFSSARTRSDIRLLSSTAILGINRIPHVHIQIVHRERLGINSLTPLFLAPDSHHQSSVEQHPYSETKNARPALPHRQVPLRRPTIGRRKTKMPFRYRTRPRQPARRRKRPLSPATRHSLPPRRLDRPP